MKRATPVVKDLVNNHQNGERRFFCRFYDACLDEAVEKSWSGFSCKDCQEFERVRLNPEQWNEDYNRCMALLCFVSFSRLKHHNPRMNL